MSLPLYKTLSTQAKGFLTPVYNGKDAEIKAFARAVIDNFQRIELLAGNVTVWDLEYLYHGTNDVSATIDASRDWRLYDFLVSFRAADSIADLCNVGNGNDGVEDTGFQTPTGTAQTIATKVINNCTLRVGCNPTTGTLEWTLANAAAASRIVYFRIWINVPATTSLATAVYVPVGNGL